MLSNSKETGNLPHDTQHRGVILEYDWYFSPNLHVIIIKIKVVLTQTWVTFADFLAILFWSFDFLAPKTLMNVIPETIRAHYGWFNCNNMIKLN